MGCSVQYNFTGWIIGWHGTNGQIVEKYATEGGPEDKKGGGVWMSGGGIAQDSGITPWQSPALELLGVVMANIRSHDAAGRMFFATGNG